jgi:carbon storage regulator
MTRHPEEGSDMSDMTRLVLTRKIYQSINIGGLVTVTVEEVHGKTVRISVQAPRGIAVHRQEIYEKILDAEPDGDGIAGRAVPAGPVTGPDRSATRPRAFGEATTRKLRAAVAAALEARPTAEVEADRPARGLPPGGGAGERI